MSVMLDGVRWFVSLHALERMAEMGVKRPEVIEVLNRPELTYPVRDGRQGAVAGRLCVVYHGDTVVTVLWNKREGRETSDPRGVASDRAAAV